jgi:hypothetical protein
VGGKSAAGLRLNWNRPKTRLIEYSRKWGNWEKAFEHRSAEQSRRWNGEGASISRARSFRRRRSSGSCQECSHAEGQNPRHRLPTSRSPSTASPSSNRPCATSTSRPWSRSRWRKRRLESCRCCHDPGRRPGRESSRLPTSAVDKTRADHRPGSDVRAGGVENGGRLDRGESNDRARPAFRSLRRAGRVPALGNGAPGTSALYCACGGCWRGLGAEPSRRRSGAWAARARAAWGV